MFSYQPFISVLHNQQSLLFFVNLRVVIRYIFKITGGKIQGVEAKNRHVLLFFKIVICFLVGTILLMS